MGIVEEEESNNNHGKQQNDLLLLLQQQQPQQQQQQQQHGNRKLGDGSGMGMGTGPTTGNHGTPPGNIPGTLIDNNAFLYRIDSDGTMVTKTCTFIGTRKEVCRDKEYQIRTKKPTRFGPASVACSDSSCKITCAEEFSKARFLFKTKKKKTKEVAKDCKFLKKKSRRKRNKICKKTVKFDGDISLFGQAFDVCPETCGKTC